MELKEYIQKMKTIQENILRYLENDNDIENLFQKVIKLLDKNTLENRYELKSILYIISMISKNRHRSSNFIIKIEKILTYLENPIKQTFSNSEIFHIFRNNLRILLFLLDEKIIAIDSSIVPTLKYIRYFYLELKPFNEMLTIKLHSKIHIEIFNKKRKIGENDNYICELIRGDLIDDFIVFVNKTSLSLNSKIKFSLFETNLFLLKKEPSLVEYAAYFGSIKIFKYLCLNNVELTPSLWLFAIHSNNSELIHLLEEKNVEMDDMLCEKCFKEAIKCHHNEIANYIQYNFLNGFNENFFRYSFHYYDFEFFPNEIDNYYLTFHYACQYDYFIIVKFLMDKIDLHEKKVNQVF